MKPINFQTLFLPLNALMTGFVFFLLSPTTRIYAAWFPEKQDSLWFFPIGVLFGSAMLWLLGALSTPFLIRCGIFEDRRAGARPETAAARIQYFQTLLPILNFLFHMLLLIAFCATLIFWGRNSSAGESGRTVSWNYVFR